MSLLMKALEKAAKDRGESSKTPDTAPAPGVSTTAPVAAGASASKSELMLEPITGESGPSGGEHGSLQHGTKNSIWDVIWPLRTSIRSTSSVGMTMPVILDSISTRQCAAALVPSMVSDSSS